jgi:O-antigen/teichoic acid export membrane protein
VKNYSAKFVNGIFGVVPFPADRAAWRSGQALRSAAAAVLATVAVFGLRFLTIPLSIRIAGAQGYGLWLTAGSLVAWAGLADIGLGSGLVQCVATGCAREDWSAVRRHVSTAVFTFAALSIPLVCAAFWLARSPAVLAALGLAHGSGLARQAGAVFLVSGLAFAASFGLNWVGPLCSALQEGYRASIASVAAGGATVCCLCLMRDRSVTITQFALANALPPVACTLVVALVLQAGRHRAIARPSPAWVSGGSVREIMTQGAPLFLVQLSDLAILNTANLFIAHFLGLGEVVRYSITLALFAAVARVCYVAVAPYWPAYADACARQDWEWVRASARRNLALSASLMVVAGACFVLLGRPLILWWAGRAALPSPALLVAMAFYFLAATCSTTTGTLLNGLGLARVRACLRLSVAGAHVVGGWWLLPSYGLAAIPVAGGLAYLVDFLMSLAWANAHIRREAGEPRCQQVYAGESA